MFKINICLFSSGIGNIIVHSSSSILWERPQCCYAWTCFYYNTWSQRLHKQNKPDLSNTKFW